MSVEQDQEMATILVRLELISHGATVNYNPSGGASGEPDDRMVAIVMRGEDYPHLAFRRRYQGCVTDKDRAAVLEAAQEELKKWGPRDWEAQKDAPSMTQAEIVVEYGVGIDPVSLGHKYLMLPRDIRKIRAKEGLDPETGKAPLVQALEVADKVTQARELKAKGLTVRQIALSLGIGTGSVSRYLQLPAAAGGNPSPDSVD